MTDSRPLTFKSVDAKKENPQNKPGNFTVKFTPELFLEENKTHLMALDHLSMTASWHNIRPEYKNNKLVISKDGGNTWETINLYLKCSLLSDSIVSGKRSNVLYSFSTSTKTRSMPFEIQPYNYLWSKINTKTITEVTFWLVDDEDREVDLNNIDISLTVVIKTKNGN